MKLETHLWAENVLLMVGTHFYLVADHSVGVGGEAGLLWERPD